MAMLEHALINTLTAKQPAIVKKIGSCFARLRYIIALSILICWIGYCGLQKDILGLYHDDGIYVVAAKSISQGTGYRIISLPNSPPQTKYPFLYPYVLSWIWSANPAFPGNVGMIKAANLIFLFLIIFTAYRFYCTSVSEPGSDGYLYAALVGANPGIFSFADFAVSDLLFVWLVLLSCCLYGNNASVWFNGWRTMILALLSVLAVLTRSAGAPLALAGFVHFLWVRRLRELAIYTMAFALALLPWFGWCIISKPDVLPSSLLGYYVRYDLHNTAFYGLALQPARAAELVWANARYFLDSLDVVWLLSLFPTLRLRVLVLTFLVVGLYAAVRRLSIFLKSFLFSYSVLILGWSFHPLRYTLPIMPLLLLFVFRGIHTLEEHGRHRWRAGGGWPLFVLVRAPIYLLVCFNIAWLVSTVQPSNDRWVRGAYGQRLDYSWGGFLETFSWIRNHTQKEDLLATAYDPMYYLYTGRKAVMPMFHKPETYFYPYGAAKPDVGSVEEIKAELQRLNVRYFVTNPLEQYAEAKAVEALVPRLLAAYSTTPHLVFSSRDGKHQIYEMPTAE